MSDLLNGNRAVKIKSGPLTQLESLALYSKELFTYFNMLGYCESHIKNFASVNNIDLLEYQSLYEFNCRKYEKLFYSSLRTRMREKIYNDQINEFSANYSDGIYHPYNPYLQKYNGAYLRTYQLFD